MSFRHQYFISQLIFEYGDLTPTLKIITFWKPLSHYSQSDYPEGTIMRVFINNLPVYHRGISPLRRGLEVGLAHGFWLVVLFAWLGPLRNTRVANRAGLLSAIGAVVISTLLLSLYAASHPPKPVTTITTPHPPEALTTDEGWREFAGGFLLSGTGSAVFAYLLSSNLDAICGLLSI